MISKIKLGLLAIIICSFPTEGFGVESSYLKGRQWDRFNVSGALDLRLQSESDNGADPRPSERISAKFGISSELDSQLALVFELSTASSSRSSRITLGDSKAPGFSRRAYGIQKAYGDWHPEDWISIKLGRTPQVHAKVGESEILFDDTIALEGTSVELEKKFEFWRLDLQGGSHFVRENYDSYYSIEQSDVMINWGQVVAYSDHFTLGAGFFNFASIQGTAFTDLNSDAAPDGNSQAPAGVVKNRYLPKQVFAETRWSLGPGVWKFFAEYIVNDDTVDPNKALWAGIGWQGEKWGSQLAYGNLDADAVPSFVTSSTFADGKTDAKGLVFTAKWTPTKKLTLDLSQYSNRLNKSSSDEQYLLTQLDCKISF